MQLCTATNTWTAIAGGGGGGAPVNATYLTQTANGTLQNEQAIGLLTSGIMRVASTTGIVTSLNDSAGIAANVSDETGTNKLVFSDNPTLVGPTLGVALATSINGLTITTSTGTLTISNGKVLTLSNTMTQTATDGSTIAFGTGGTVVYTNVSTLSSLSSVGTINTGVWNGTAITFAKGGTGLTAASDDTVMVSSGSAWVAKSIPDCIDTSGNHLNYTASTNSFSCGNTSSGGGGGGTYTAGNGLQLVGSQFSIQTTETADLASTQTFAGAKTFDNFLLTPGTTAVTLGRLGFDSTALVPFWGTGVATKWAAPNLGTTQGDIFYCSDSATPCTLARLAADAAAGKFLRNNGASSNPSYDFVTFGNLSGTASATQIPATPLTAGTSVTLSGNDRYFVCTSTCTVTVPVPSAGVRYCVYNDNNVSTVITLAAIGSSSRYENTARTAYGTAGTGTLVSGGAVKDAVCIVGRDTTHYSTISFTGTWTAN